MNRMKNRSLLCIGATLVGSLLASACGADDVATAIDTYTEESEFIFVGTVDVPNSSTMVLPSVQELAVVTVNNTLHDPDSYRLEPQQLTIQASGVPAMQPGEQRLFFANAWIFGETLALRGVSHVPLESPPDTIALQAMVNAAVRRKEVQALSDRLLRTSHVLAGQVVAVFPDEAAPRIISEHDPSWWIATLTMENALKGSMPDTSEFSGMDGAPPDTAAISFPTNPRWYDLPRLKAGDAGVFLLHDSLASDFITPNPALIRRSDLRPLSDISLVDSLLSP